jgi:hypothetical protein
MRETKSRWRQKVSFESDPTQDHVWQCMAMNIVGPLTPSGPENHT